MSATTQEPTKDEEQAHPVAAAWRPRLAEVVTAIADGDYALSRGIPSVDVSQGTAGQIRRYVLDYGETIVALAVEAWNTSVMHWMGSYWDVLVDIWTAESGLSDLVLRVRVFEEGSSFRFRFGSLHVP